MKLTKEQLKQADADWVNSPHGVKKWLESYEFPDPPVESMWIWGGDRLPTKEDADCDGCVATFDPEWKSVRLREIRDDALKNRFWTPAPKYLKKPEPPKQPKPPATFMAWYSQLGRRDREKTKQLLFAAFTAGQQSQNK